MNEAVRVSSFDRPYTPSAARPLWPIGNESTCMLSGATPPKLWSVWREVVRGQHKWGTTSYTTTVDTPAHGPGFCPLPMSSIVKRFPIYYITLYLLDLLVAYHRYLTSTLPASYARYRRRSKEIRVAALPVYLLCNLPLRSSCSTPKRQPGHSHPVGPPSVWPCRATPGA